MDHTAQPRHTADLDILSGVVRTADIRLVTIMGVGYIERYLEDLLVLRMPGLTEKMRSDLFDRGALQHGRPRLSIAEALGLVTPDVGKEVRALFDIRNRFAHHIDVTDCSDPVIASKIAKFRLVSEVAEEEGFRGLRDSTPESILRLMVASCALAIHQIIENPTA